MTISLVYLTCVWILLLSHVHGQDPPAAPSPPIRSMFHCSRSGMSCNNEADCLQDTGLCDCPEDFEGYDCSVNSTYVDPENCDCLNGGICVEDEVSRSCYCPDIYYGDMCENIRVSQTCNPDSIEMTIAPFSNDVDGFGGLIYVYENPVSECFLNDDSGNGVYTNTISFDSCGGAGNDTNEDGDVELSFTVLVQYKSNILTQSDQQFVFKCIIRQTDSNVEVPGNMVSNDKDKNPLDKQEVSGELVPVDLSLVDADTGEEVTEPQGVGSKLKLVFTLNGGNVYDSFRVEQVTANNGLEDPMESLDFVKDSCVPSDADGIVTGFSGDQTSRVELPFTLFKFLYSSQVAFRVTVKLCKGTGGCNSTDCEMFEGLGRKRRAVEAEEYDVILEDMDEAEDSAWERLESPGVFVWIPGHRQGKEKSGRLRPIESSNTLTESTLSIHKPGLCFQNIWFIVCMVAIVTAFTLFGALIAVLCLRRRGVDKSNETMGQSYVTNPVAFDNKGFGSTKF